MQAVHAIESLVVMDLEQALSPLQTDIRAGLVRDAHDFNMFPVVDARGVLRGL